MDTQELLAHAWKASPAATAAELAGTRRGLDGSRIPRWYPADHLVRISAHIARRVYEGDRKLIVSLPPRHGKSRLISRWTPLWFLDRFPDRHVQLISYEANYAKMWGRFVRNTAEAHRLRLRFDVSQDSKAANEWTTTQGGGMFTAGVGGPLTGRGADLQVIDDPIKNSEQAQSEVIRNGQWDWWETTASTRLEPGATALLVMTRWHEADLAGMLLEREPGEWEEIRLPAIAEQDDWLGRQPGEPLWQERWALDRLEAIRRRRSAQVWASLYQQRPTPAEGGVWKRSWMRYARLEDGVLVLQDGRRYPLTTGLRSVFLTVDLAASLKSRSDWTVIGCWGITNNDDLVLLDLHRARMEGPDHEPAIRAMMGRWGASVAWVERATFGLTLIQQLRRNGIPVRELEADSDKVSRAYAATPAFEAGQVYFLAGAPWLDELLAELLAFPNSAHDDQADVVSYAVRVLYLLTQQTSGLPDLGGGSSRYDDSVTMRGGGW